ncbi:hypothetical protein INT43_000203 [Umbelopsis isabellina]|uniref:Tryptophan synthase beta chain-like PALP domain-containing protein n=1 Tax=Mortierella isabellina TaxID=91625 RepID=A0A8H7UAJ6_MORIS|nr:hypothetical protein INT43_000203 [Umbelopsis isabellina]
MTGLSFSDIEAAAARIQVHKTNVVSSSILDQIAGSEHYAKHLLFKCELLQKTGSFKFRGASNAVMSLNETDARKGVCTHSSGNHAQALALAAKIRGIPAYVVMPSNSPQVKKSAVRGYGAQVIECEPTLQAREDAAKKVIEDTGATFIHPFNNYNVMAGQGTIGLEFVQQAQEMGTPLDAVIVPVGGGGMLSGISTAVRHLSPNTKVFAAEPINVNDCSRSYSAKSHQLNAVGATSVADGLLTNVGTNTLPIIMEKVDGVFTVSEEDIIRTTKLVWTYLKLCIEPSAAVGVAVALYNKEFRAKSEELDLRNIGVILCGGNVDIVKIARLIESIEA